MVEMAVGQVSPLISLNFDRMPDPRRRELHGVPFVQPFHSAARPHVSELQASHE